VKQNPRKPTNAEVAILRVLWSRGPSTVRDVARTMGREAAYTTVLKLMQNMTDKGLVVRDESSRTHVYSAANPEEQTQRQLVTDMVDGLRRLGSEAHHGGAGGSSVAEGTGGDPETSGQTSRRLVGAPEPDTGHRLDL
jgi:predicted transcriptional regulator